MFLFVILFILLSVYIAQNKNISDGIKTGWFVFLGIVVVINVLLGT